MLNTKVSVTVTVFGVGYSNEVNYNMSVVDTYLSQKVWLCFSSTRNYSLNMISYKLHPTTQLKLTQ